MSRLLVIIGHRTAQEIHEAFSASKDNSFNVVEQLYLKQETFESEIAPAYERRFKEICFTIGIADQKSKNQIREAVEARGWKPFTVSHPSAVVSPSAIIQEGCFICPGAVISSNAQISKHSIVHIHSSIGHDAVIEECVSILPGARISGGVHVGARSLIGSNAFVAQGVKIGDDCLVDAMSYVQRDVKPKHIVSPRTPKPVRRVDLR